MKVLMTMAAALMLLVGSASAQIAGPETPIGDCVLDTDGQTLCCTGAGPLDGGYIACSEADGGCCADDNGAGDANNDGVTNDACGNDGGTSATCIPPA